jgi:hypothetical protein
MGRERVEGVENAPVCVREEMAVEVERDPDRRVPICAWRYFGCARAATISAA